MSADGFRIKKGLKFWFWVLGSLLAIFIALTTLIKGCSDVRDAYRKMFPRAQAGLMVMVHPDAIGIYRNQTAKVIWILIETNKVGLRVESRTGVWRTAAKQSIKEVGPFKMEGRIEPSGAMIVEDAVLLAGDAANEAEHGKLILEEVFKGRDDNGYEVTGRARLTVEVLPPKQRR